MNQRTENLLQGYKPELAIIVYQGGRQNYYLESHPINVAGQLLEGRPLQEDTIHGMISCFFEERKRQAKVSGIIPECLLKFIVLPGDKYTMVWYRPAERRTIFFADGLHLPSGPVSTPPMVYKVTSGLLNVYAMVGSARPEEDTPLFMAPFHNVSPNGSVCLGSAKVKKPDRPTYASLIKFWEDMFWLSEFTHLAGNTNPTKTNLSTIWRGLVQNGGDFPVDELMPYSKTKIRDL